MCGGSKSKGRHDRLSLCAYIVEGLGDGCPHWSEEIEKQKQRCRILEINGSRDVNGNETEGQMRDTGDKQEPRSEWELMKQNITDAGYQTETGADKLMIMKQKQAIV